MAKKLVWALVFVLLTAGGVFAQTADKKHNVIVDAAPLVKGTIASDSDTKSGFFAVGVDYQYVLNERLSVGGRLDFILGTAWNLSASYFGLAAHGRYYLTAMLEKAFLDAGFGFNTASLGGETEFFGLTLELKVGYTVPLNPKLKVEPTLAYILAKSGGFPTPLGLQIGLGVCFGF